MLASFGLLISACTGVQQNPSSGESEVAGPSGGGTATGGTVRIGTNPIKFSETPIRDYTAPPTQGQHNDEVYKGLLGLDDGELRRLKDAGIV